MTGPRGSTLTASVTSTLVTQGVLVGLTTFDTLTDPVSYLLTQLKERVLAEISAPSTATLTATLQTSSILGDGQRVYRWSATATWTV